MDVDSIPSPSRAAPSPPPLIVKLALPVTAEPLDIPMQRVATIQELKSVIVSELAPRYPDAMDMTKIHLFYGGNEILDNLVVGEINGLEDRSERIQIAIAGAVADGVASGK
jgi:hypothetical protein